MALLTALRIGEIVGAETTSPVRLENSPNTLVSPVVIFSTRPVMLKMPLSKTKITLSDLSPKDLLILHSCRSEREVLHFIGNPLKTACSSNYNKIALPESQWKNGADICQTKPIKLNTILKSMVFQFSFGRCKTSYLKESLCAYLVSGGGC